MDSKRQSQLTPLTIILLVELLLVTLAVVLVPMFARMEPRKRAEHVDIATISNLKAAIDTFQADIGRFPREDEGLAALLQAPPDVKDTWAGPYIQGGALPLDSWGHPFRYMRLVKGSKDEYTIISAGPDGTFGPLDDIDMDYVR
jgi:general secretion pathway protein G